MYLVILLLFPLCIAQIWNPMFHQQMMLPPHQVPMINVQNGIPLGLPVQGPISLPLSLQSNLMSNNIVSRGRPEIGGTIETLAATQSMVNSPDFARVSLLNFLNDKDNFHAQGCGYDGIREYCHDGLNLCKGGCRDFGNSMGIHDCRCVPLGYANILASLGRKK
uniref:Defensin-like protein n=1 Tax=Parastrongyloides trichosuri TaxID=131310 RepID=A0A0N4ZJX9_PARTI